MCCGIIVDMFLNWKCLFFLYMISLILYTWYMNNVWLILPTFFRKSALKFFTCPLDGVSLNNLSLCCFLQCMLLKSGIFWNGSTYIVVYFFEKREDIFLSNGIKSQIYKRPPFLILYSCDSMHDGNRFIFGGHSTIRWWSIKW